MFKRQLSFLIPMLLSGWLVSCSSNVPAEDTATPVVQVPVTVAGVSHDTMSEYAEVNATAVFLLKNFVKANANGYLQSSNVHNGRQVSKGQVLFTVTTKEAQSLGNTINKLDPSFHFSGTNSIRAGGNGFITQLDHQAGDYVQDGEQLAVISDQSSFVFVMNIPYELHSLTMDQKNVSVILPGGEVLQGIVVSSLPQMDSASQTERITIKVNAGHNIPENLIAKVRILKRARLNATSVPKAAVLTDETQSKFWIMKMAGDSIAVKIPVTKGMETGDRVEILSPPLNEQDRILITGNYGLDDTARVKIMRPTE